MQTFQLPTTSPEYPLIRVEAPNGVVMTFDSSHTSLPSNIGQVKVFLADSRGEPCPSQDAIEVDTGSPKPVEQGRKTTATSVTPSSTATPEASK